MAVPAARSRRLMRVLIINSDSPNNRGDRAILVGNINLIKHKWPEAEIWALSEHAERDSQWYGIDFLPMSAYSVNPLHFFQLLSFAKKADYIFWGGGELLKDYTNKIGVVYWVLKMLPITWVNNDVYGAFQGIGPTKSPLSQKLIAFIINRTKVFIVRDDESKQKLLSWGVRTPLIASYDPAVISNITPLRQNKPLVTKLAREEIDSAFLKNCVGIGVRKWFHYKKGTWIPFKFKVWAKDDPATNQRLEDYTDNLAELCDWTIETYDTNILFFPMHMLSSENDASFSETVQQRMKHPDRVLILKNDTFSPSEYQSVISECRFFIGSRLHSSILATSAGVPSMVYYYVDKGRLFFEQLNMQRFSQPIEDLLDTKNLAKAKAEIRTLVSENKEIKAALAERINQMKVAIHSDFEKALTFNDDKKD